MKKIIYVLALLIASVTSISAQWTSLPGPYGCDTWGFYAEDSIIYTSTTNAIFRSNDDGHSWLPLSLSLPNNRFFMKLLFKKDSILFIELEVSDSGNNMLLYFSKNNGKTFDLLLNYANDYSVVSINDTLLVARNTSYWDTIDSRSLIRSNDRGRTWINASPSIQVYFSKLQLFDGVLYVIRSKSASFENDWQICRSIDGGRSWDSLYGIARHDYSHPLAQPIDYTISGGTSILLVVDLVNNSVNRYQRFLKISLTGDSVKDFQFPTKNSKPSIDTVIDNFQYSNKNLYAATQNHIYRYAPARNGWDVITNNIPRYSVDKITNYLPLSQQGLNEILISFYEWSRWNSGYTNGIYRFTAGEGVCLPSDTGITSTQTTQIFNFHDTLYTITAATGYPLYSSADHGETWKAIQLPFDIHGYDIRTVGGSPKGLLFSNRDSIFLKNGSNTEMIVNYIGRQILSLLPIGNSIFCRTGNEFFRSDDSGASWIKLTQPPLMTLSGTANTVFKDLMIVGGDSIVISSDGCFTWKKVKGIPYAGFLCHYLASDQNNIYAVANYRDGTIENYGVFRSTDSGTTWGLFLSKLNFGLWNILPLDNKILFGSDLGVYMCNKDGSNFGPIFRNQTLKKVNAFAVDSEYFYVGTSGYGLFRAKLNDVLQYVDGVSSPITVENISNISFQIFPNPSTNSIQVQIANYAGKIRYALFDALGTPRKNGMTSDNSFQIDIPDLPSGNYYLRISGAQGMPVTKRVVVVK